METVVALLVGLTIGAGAVWFIERYHERKQQELMNVIGQMQVTVEALRDRIQQLEEPPIPTEEL